MKLKISHRIWLLVALMWVITVAPVWYLVAAQTWQKTLVTLGFLLVTAAVTRFLFKDVNEGLAALEIGLLNLKDGDFSSSLVYENDDELGKMCLLYNETVDQLRQEKRWLYQRELLLDKITQSSPSVLLLVNSNQQIVFSNIAAKRFFNVQNGLEGSDLEDLLEKSPQSVKDAMTLVQDGLFTINLTQSNNNSQGDETEQNKVQSTQTWHISTGKFLLNNQSHTLFILKQMTREISRQEVAVWKKVIRVISHELNNSLGPISSMLHSGRILSQKVDDERLTRVFSTIDGRIKHLSEFVQGYGQFAKIPEPKVTALSSQQTLQSLAQQWKFTYNTTQDETIYADRSQLEQLLINLLKNAHESGSDIAHIIIEVNNDKVNRETRISVKDAGKGISPSSLSSVLIPFYSTKSNGSGLGLALCREIVEAHHGQIALNNRPQTGLEVTITLPWLKDVKP